MSEEKQMCKNHPNREAFVADVCYECLENSYAASAAYLEALKLDQPAPAEAAAVIGDFVNDLANLSVSDASQIDELKAEVKRLQNVENSLRHILSIVAIKESVNAIWRDYLETDDPCPFCSNPSDEPHDENCVMLDIVWFVDGA